MPNDVWIAFDWATNKMWHLKSRKNIKNWCLILQPLFTIPRLNHLFLNFWLGSHLKHSFSLSWQHQSQSQTDVVAQYMDSYYYRFTFWRKNLSNNASMQSDWFKHVRMSISLIMCSVILGTFNSAASVISFPIWQ